MAYVRHCREGLSDIAGCSVTTGCPSGLTVGMRCRKYVIRNQYLLINWLYIVSSCSRIVQSYRDAVIAGGRLQYFGLSLALVIFEQGGISIRLV